jgi:hypothetical protein
MHLRHLLLALPLALAALTDASAQYQWRDAQGRMVFSDMPPPTSVAPSQVLRAPARPAPVDGPGGSGVSAAATAATSASPSVAPRTAIVPAGNPVRKPAGASPSGAGAGDEEAAPAAGQPGGGAGKPAAPISAADKELDYRKRQLERAEADKKAREQSDQAQRMAKACEESRAEIRTIESGMRMGYINDKGEREILDDAQRAQRLDAARKSMREACRS